MTSGARLELTRLVVQAEKQLSEIDQLHADLAHWNRINPAERPVGGAEVDPDGRLEFLRSRLRTFITDANQRLQEVR